MKESGKGFCLFFDWIDDLDHLDGADAWEVVKALCGYYREGSNPVEAVEGSLRVVVSIMFHQIKRAERVSEVRREAAKKRAIDNPVDFVEQRSAKVNKGQQRSTQAQQRVATETDTETYTENSFVLSGASARTCEEKENDERDEIDEDPLPPGARVRLEGFLKEEAKRKYLGGTLGRGKVLLSEEQFNKICDELSYDEIHKYIGIVADCEENGQHYTKKTHYQAIMEMAQADRRV